MIKDMTVIKDMTLVNWYSNYQAHYSENHMEFGKFRHIICQNSLEVTC